MPKIGETLNIDGKELKIVNKQNDAYLLEDQTGSLSNITEAEIQKQKNDK